MGETLPLSVNTYPLTITEKDGLMHKLADLRTSRTLRNSLVIPRNLDYREHRALSGSRKASEVSGETGFW